jgi:hypothetical protein
MALREFVDGSGKTWRVWETRPTTGIVREEFKHGWLTFENGHLRRRLAPAPPGWYELSEQELRELCIVATPDARRKRLIE